MASLKHQQLILSYLGLLLYGLNSSSQGVGIVSMTHRSSNSSNHDKSKSFDYTVPQKGVLLSMHIYGYTVGNLVFGYLADLYGPMTISPIAGGLSNGLLLLLYPTACVYGGYAFDCGGRLLQGFLVSCFYPCAFAHMSKWLIPEEQSKFSWIWTGQQAGQFLITLISGHLVSIAGWPGLYYFIGIASLSWGFLCMVHGVNGPENHRTITSKDYNLIKGYTKKAERRQSRKFGIPWVDMLKSKPLWAYLVAETCDTYGGNLVYPFEPTYLHGVFHLTIKQIGYAVASNYLVNIPVSFLCTYLATKMEGCVSLDYSRKMWNTIGSCGEAFALFTISSIPHDGPSSSIILLIAAYTVSAATHLGYVSNLLDIAPKFAGTVAGVLMSISGLVASSAPTVTALLLEDEGDIESWRKVFALAGVVYLLGNAVFLIYGSTEPQYWNHIDKDEGDQEKLEPLV